MASQFQIYKDAREEYRFRLMASNGQNIGSSEGYSAKGGVDNGVASVKKNAMDKTHFDIFEGKNGKWYFNLKAGNHQVILSSQGYSSKTAAAEGVDSVMRNAPEANIVYQ